MEVVPVTDHTGLKAMGYVRVSTVEQETGLEAQREAILSECERRGWSVVGIVEDHGHSARDLRRPGVQSVLDALETGAAQALVVAKLDRLSRSLLDFAGLMAVAQKQGWSLVALDCAVDTTSPGGEAMASVLAVFAQFERRMIGQRTRDALAVKRAQGVRLGRPQALPDAVIARIVSSFAADETLSGIARGLNADHIPTAQGGARWWPSTVRAVIHSQAALKCPGRAGLRKDEGAPASAQVVRDRGVKLGKELA